MTKDNTPWILTASGKKFHYGLNDPNEFDIEDVASSLSRICRYTGHLSVKYEDDIYPVGQHSVYVLRLLRDILKAPKETHAWGLLHDAPEAYFGDVNSPLKSLLPAYKLYEGASAEAFRTRYNVPYNEEVERWVKHADIQLLYAESAELTAVPSHLWDDPATANHSIREIDPDFYPWRPKKAKEEFLKEFSTL